MSDNTDRTLNRYLDQQPGMRRQLLHDPVQHAQTELMRRTLDAAERAMADEGIPEETRSRIVNRIVWGEPEGLVDVHALLREKLLAAFEVRPEHIESWEAIAAAAASPTRTNEERP